MSRPFVTIVLVLGVLLCSSTALLAQVDGNCGSTATAPAQPGASNENEPRSCDGAFENETAAQPPMPDTQPSGEDTLPQPSDAVENPEEIPQPSSQ